jgi:hypothetical protein
MQMVGATSSQAATTPSTGVYGRVSHALFGNETVSKVAEDIGYGALGTGAAVLLTRRFRGMPHRTTLVPALVAAAGLGLTDVARNGRGSTGVLTAASDGVDALVDKAAPPASKRRTYGSLGLRVLGGAALGAALLLNPRRVASPSVERWLVQGATKAPEDARRILSLERTALAFGGLKLYSVGSGLGKDDGVTADSLDSMVDGSDPVRSLDHAASTLEGSK